MRILAIETSCDETALAILSVRRKLCTIEAHQIASQASFHAQYGGVFPAMAKREHSRNIVPLFVTTLKEAGLYDMPLHDSSFTAKRLTRLADLLTREQEMLPLFVNELTRIKKPDIDRIAVTVGPGLEPALWVGINFARALSIAWGIPIVPVNHMEGHILSVVVPSAGRTFNLHDLKQNLPAISLLVSGGHTELVRMKKVGSYTLVGQTLDDAAGEAFDKVARMLELPYPGGPEISKLASIAREERLVRDDIKLPRPMIHSGDLNFSFSGLKTAVLYLLKKLGTLDERTKIAVAREFENSVCDVLIKKTVTAAKKYGAKSIIVGGGVSANRELAKRLTAESPVPVTFPTRELSTDNAVMIGIAGYFGKKVRRSSKKLIAKGNLAL